MVFRKIEVPIRPEVGRIVTVDRHVIESVQKCRFIGQIYK